MHVSWLTVWNWILLVSSIKTQKQPWFCTLAAWSVLTAGEREMRFLHPTWKQKLLHPHLPGKNWTPVVVVVGLGGAAGEQPRGGRPTGSLSPSRARGPEPRGQAQRARSVAPFLICCWSLNTRSLLHPAASASPWLQPLCKGPQSSSWCSYEKTETERAQAHLALAFSRNFLKNSYFIREAEELLCPGSLPQTPAVGWGGARATSRAGTQSTSVTWRLLEPSPATSEGLQEQEGGSRHRAGTGTRAL